MTAIQKTKTIFVGSEVLSGCGAGAWLGMLQPAYQLWCRGMIGHVTACLSTVVQGHDCACDSLPINCSCSMCTLPFVKSKKWQFITTFPWTYMTSPQFITTFPWTYMSSPLSAT
jgi:hypothetical protein